MASMLLRKVRKLISQGRERTDDGEFDLDLTYITPRLMAMGLPAEGLTAAYRNPIDDVVGYLEKHHANGFMLYNPSEIAYDTEKFSDQVLNFGFKDHHAPPLALLYTIASSIHGWLAADAANVACIHCRAGKGRTGTIISAYLLFSGLVSSAQEALDYYAYMRARRRKGGQVTNPCQRNAVAMFEAVVYRGVPVADFPRRLLRVVLHGLPPALSTSRGFRPYIEVYDAPGGTLLASTRREVSVMEHYLAADGPQTMVIDLTDVSDADAVESVSTPAADDESAPPVLGALQGVAIAGDLYLRVLHAAGPRTLALRRFPDTYLFRLQAHTAFMEPVVRLTKAELDDGRKDDRLDDGFEVELISVSEAEARMPEGVPAADGVAASAPAVPVLVAHDPEAQKRRHGAECFPSGPPSRTLVDMLVAQDEGGTGASASASAGADDETRAAALEARATKRVYTDPRAEREALGVLSGHVHTVTCVVFDAESRRGFVGTASGAVYIHAYPLAANGPAGTTGQATVEHVLEPAGERDLSRHVTAIAVVSAPEPLVLVGDAGGSVSAWCGREFGHLRTVSFAGDGEPGEPGVTALVTYPVPGRKTLRVFVAGRGRYIAEVGRAMCAGAGESSAILPSVVLEPQERVAGMLWTETMGLVVGLTSGKVGTVRSGLFQPLFSLPASWPALTSIAWNGVASALYTLAADGSVGVWDTSSLTLLVRHAPLTQASGPFTVSAPAGAVPVTGRSMWCMHSGSAFLARDVIDGDVVFELAAAPSAYCVTPVGDRVVVFLATFDQVSVLVLKCE